MILSSRVLFVVEKKTSIKEVANVLEASGYEYSIVDDLAKIKKEIELFDFLAVLIDFDIEIKNSVLAAIKKIDSEITCIILGDSIGKEASTRFLEQGVYACIEKPFSSAEFKILFERCGDKLKSSREKAEIERSLKKRNKEMEEINVRLRLLVESTKSLRSGSYLGEIGEILLQAYAENMAAEGGSLYYKRKNRLELIHTIDPGHSPKVIDLPLRKGSFMEKVVSTGKPLLIQDLENKSYSYQSGWNGYKNSSILIIPIANNSGEVEGVISLHNKTFPPFTQQDLEIGLILASYTVETIRASQAIKELKKSEKRFRQLIELLPEIIFETDLEGRLLFINKKGMKTLGLSLDDIRGSIIIQDLILPEYRGEFIRNREKLLNKENFLILACSIKRKDGTEFPIHINMNAIRTGSKFTGFRGIIIDLTNQKSIEEKLRKSLGEKKVLINEIHHRVKNNLQVISSLLSLQSGYIDDKKALDMFTDSRNRVYSMGLLHEQLYKTIDSTGIEFKTYVKSLIGFLKSSFHGDADIEQNIGDISLDIDVALPCGLIINELISNCYKYAFPEKKEDSKIIISIKEKETEYEFIVKDNGIGVDRNFDFRNTKSLGLKLVHAFVSQINGKIDFSGENGCEYIITFPKV